MLKKWYLILFYPHHFVPVLFKCILGRFPEYIPLIQQGLLEFRLQYLWLCANIVKHQKIVNL